VPDPPYASVLAGPRGDLGYVAYAIFVGDNRSFAVIIMAPVAPGLQPIGDALCHTNPSFAFGASMALQQAFTLVRRVDLLDPPDRLERDRELHALALDLLRGAPRPAGPSRSQLLQALAA
jgi:hypothetical protein